MSEIFEKDVRTINEHIKTIFRTGELIENSTIRKFRIVRQEGKRKVSREIEHYNLDMIISVGYRVKSVRGSQFRIWATQQLKDFLVKGYAINEKRLEQQQQELIQLKTGIQILSRAIEAKNETKENELLNLFAKGLELLDDYDHEELDTKGKINQENKTIISNEALAALTLFIATSKTEEVDAVKRFIISILNRNLNQIQSVGL